jgi:hypothetical protein
MELIQYVIKKIDKDKEINEHYYLYFTNCMTSKLSISKKIKSVYGLVYTNGFITDKRRNILINLFNKAQKVYWGFTRLALIYKNKKTKMCDITESLYGVPFKSCKKNNTIVLIENNRKYKFRVNELLKLWKTALETSEGFVPNPKIPINPYTGLPFSRANLYNIYFFVKFNTIYNIPALCNIYFSLSFNTKLFRKKVYPFLREKAIVAYLEKSDADTLFYDCINMLRANEKIFKNSNVDEQMSRKHRLELVFILKDILRNYLFSTFSINPFTKKEHKKIFVSIAKSFMEQHPTFGRRIFSTSSNIYRTENFNRFAVPIGNLASSQEDEEDDEDSWDTDDGNNSETVD